MERGFEAVDFIVQHQGSERWLRWIGFRVALVYLLQAHLIFERSVVAATHNQDIVVDPRAKHA